MAEPKHEDREAMIYRFAVGLASIALAGTLLYGAYRFSELILPKYGPGFVYVPIVMVGLAVWMAVRGVLALRRGPRE